MLYQSTLIALVVLACIGVLHSAFNDNLLQRAGLCCIALGSAAEVIAPGVNPRLLLITGCLVYAIGVVIKVWQRANKPTHHSTDN